MLVASHPVPRISFTAFRMAWENKVLARPPGVHLIFFPASSPFRTNRITFQDPKFKGVWIIFGNVSIN